MNELLERACAEFRDDLLLLSSGELEVDRRRRLQVHLEQCAGCAAVAREDSLVEETYRESVEEELGDDRWRELVNRTLPEKRRSPRARTAWMRVAAALLIFASGALVGSLGPSRRSDLERLETRLATLETSALISRLRPTSSAERLGALMELDRRPRLSAEAWAALLAALDSDPSPNVRLGVVDALRRMETITPVEAYLQTLLLRQDSEIVAAGLIELMVERDLRDMRGVLRQVADDPPSERLRELAVWAIDSMGGDA